MPSTGSALPQQDHAIEKAFPRLAADGYTITSPRDNRYNCIAWAAGDNKRKWWPVAFQGKQQGGAFWPRGIDLIPSVEAFEQAYGTLGYARCSEGTLEEGMEKVAIYCTSDGKVQHAAVQLPSGEWSSKLGNGWDLTHATPEGVGGSMYGEPVAFLSRSVDSPKKKALERAAKAAKSSEAAKEKKATAARKRQRQARKGK